MTREQVLALVEVFFATREISCPVCGNKKFSVEGLEVALEYDPERHLAHPGRSVPRVVLACGHCAHVLEFALRAMQQAVSQGRRA